MIFHYEEHIGNFCGHSVRVGGILSWDEVKHLAIGMEVLNDGSPQYPGAVCILEHRTTNMISFVLSHSVQFSLMALFRSRELTILFQRTFLLRLAFFLADMGP